jgi:hypothetical protein
MQHSIFSEAGMDLDAEIRAVESNPHKLEQLYQAARQKDQADDFQSALLVCYEETPDNLLYAAWFYRFQQITDDSVKPRRGVNWIAAVPLSILTGLIFWALSDVDRLVVLDQIPHLLLWWSPIATMSALIFLALTSRKNYGRALALGLGLLAATAYAIVLAPALDLPWKVEQYIVLAAIHLPLLCWIALGTSVLGFNSSTEDRFSFLIKSIEVMIVAGLYLIAGMIFGRITVGMFEALSISLPDIWLRLIAAGGFGLLPVLAVATVYDPGNPPSEQDFDHGLSQFVATMMRLLLPPTLGVLVIYIIVIPFNFLEPYENRDVLIVYNLMLFGILGLLLGATPTRGDDLSPRLQKWLRIGIIVVAILAVLISIYALSATVFRTVEGGLTLNRLTIIGWNSINISILFWLIYKQFKDGREKWIEASQSVFSLVTNAYIAWGLFLLIAVPLLF